MKIWALHGFLGLPSDFDSLKSACLKWNPDLSWHSVDYLRIRELSPGGTLSEWGAAFNQYVQSQSLASEKPVLIGYSQGGRLAMQALMDKPSLWSAAILISSNTGIKASEKLQRQQNDREWAQRFLAENFQKTVEKWNAQSVFQGSREEPQRREADYNRRQLADCLTQWSVANQEDFSSHLSKIQIPILYVAGDQDAKYCQIGQSLSQKQTNLELQVVASSGHRVLFDQPEALAQSICQFLKTKNP